MPILLRSALTVCRNGFVTHRRTASIFTAGPSNAASGIHAEMARKKPKPIVNDGITANEVKKGATQVNTLNAAAPSYNGIVTASSTSSQPVYDEPSIPAGGSVYPGSSSFSYYGGVYGQYPPTSTPPPGPARYNTRSQAQPIPFFTPSTPYPQPIPAPSNPTSSSHTPPRPKRTRPPPRLIAPIPTPSPSYLTPILSHTPSLLISPRPLLIVLDLNGVLIHRSSSSKNPTSFRPRAGVQELLSYLFANHHVMIWTSTKRHNALAILARLLTPSQNQRLVGVWCREQCGLSERHFDSRVQIHKHLSWIWRDEAISSEHGFDAGNTLLVDDSLLKGVAEPYNLLHVEEWDGQVEDVPVLAGVEGVIRRAAWVSHVASYKLSRREGGGREELEREIDAAIAERGDDTGLEKVESDGEVGEDELVRSMQSLGIRGADEVKDVKKKKRDRGRKKLANAVQESGPTGPETRHEI